MVARTSSDTQLEKDMKRRSIKKKRSSIKRERKTLNNISSKNPMRLPITAKRRITGTM